MSEVLLKAELARQAGRLLLNCTAQQKNDLIKNMAQALVSHATAIVAANELDIAHGHAAGMSLALQDRLRLTKERISAIAQSMREVADLPEPSGIVLSETVRPNGLVIKKVSVPMGVIAMIYESRPNVTADAATLCLKAGSAVILRGGSDAINSNKMIVKVLREAITECGVTAEIIQLIESPDRALVGELMTLNSHVDLLIPRGGAGLIQRVVREATVPVLETGVGNCHIYVDRSADLMQAYPIVINAKTQRPSVCNAAESLLVHAEIADRFLPEMLKQLFSAHVVVHGCERTARYDQRVLAATEADYAQEYLALEISIKIVDSLDLAIEHITKYGTKHTEAILANDQMAIERFTQAIDAAAVVVNASTRFTDGGEFGFGCEIGISTQKMHARGPMGLAEIMTYKYIVTGTGQVRA